MANLTLHLRGHWFDEIKAGHKLLEFRRATAYWEARLGTTSYDTITLCRGYPSKSDQERRLIRAWRGCFRTVINHPEFGPGPVRVFAIDVSTPLDGA